MTSSNHKAKPYPLPPKRGFTENYLDNLRPPKSGTFQIVDPITPGFYAHIGKTRITFSSRVKNAKTKNMVPVRHGTYGSYPGQISLDTGREKHHDLKKQLREGATVQEKGFIFTGENDKPKTIRQLIKLFSDKRLVSRGDHKDSEAALKYHLIENLDGKGNCIGDCSINKFSNTDLANLIYRIKERGHESRAKKILSLIKLMFKWAHQLELVDIRIGENLSAVNTFDLQEGEGHYALDIDDEGRSVSDLPEIVRAWHGIDNTKKVSLQTNYALKILLLTGIRPIELREAKISNINFDKAEMFIQKQKLKPSKSGGRPRKTKAHNKGPDYTIPLSPLVIQLLKALIQVPHPKGNDYLLSSEEAKTGHIGKQTLSKAVRRMFGFNAEGKRTIENAVFFNVPDKNIWTPYDFRSTFRTQITSHKKIKAQYHIAEKCLNHSLGKISKAYDKGSYLEERREVLNIWSEVVSRAVGLEV